MRCGEDLPRGEGLWTGDTGEGTGGRSSGPPSRSGLIKAKEKGAGREIAGKPENLVPLDKQEQGLLAPSAQEDQRLQIQPRKNIRAPLDAKAQSTLGDKSDA